MGVLSFLGIGKTYFSPKEDYKAYYIDGTFLSDCINLYADFASQVRIQEVDDKGEAVENSEYLKFLNEPNEFQNQTDFIKEMVVNLLTTGMSIQYGNFFKNGNLRASPSLYNLEFNNIKFPEIKDPYTLTRDKIKTLKVVETLADGVQRTRELHELAFFYDTIARKNYRGCGTAGNLFFNPISRISSILYSIQTILNSEDMMCFLTSNPVNSIISRKATGAGIAPLSGDQKNDIEAKLNGRGRYGAGMGKAGDVIATNETLERLDLTRDNKKLQTIEMQENAKENIRNRYLIPKDFFGGSTYENQQFAEAKFILGNVKTITDNWLQELTNKSPKYFKERGTRLIGTYDHLPSVIAIKTKLKNEGFKFKAEALVSLLGAFEKAQELGVSNDFEQFVKERGFEDFINNQ
nr:MAG TPA: portal protein [Caudoviricetes sp.]